jgi:hypothetical protein
VRLAAISYRGGSPPIRARGAVEGSPRRRSVDVVSTCKTKRVTGGKVLAGRLPSRSVSEAGAEQSCRHSFVDRRQVLGGAHAGGGDGASFALPPVRLGGTSGRGTLGAGGSRAALAASARPAHGRRGGGRALASSSPLPVPALQRDGYRAAARSGARAALQRDGHRAGVRDVRPVRLKSSGDAYADISLAFGRAGVAGHESMAGRHRARSDLRPGAPLAAALASPSTSRAGCRECAGGGARRGVVGRTRLRRRGASRVCVIAPAGGAVGPSTSLDRRAQRPTAAGSAPRQTRGRSRGLGRGKAFSPRHG